MRLRNGTLNVHILFWRKLHQTQTLSKLLYSAESLWYFWNGFRSVSLSVFSDLKSEGTLGSGIEEYIVLISNWFSVDMVRSV